MKSIWRFSSNVDLVFCQVVLLGLGTILSDDKHILCFRVHANFAAKGVTIAIVKKTMQNVRTCPVLIKRGCIVFCRFFPRSSPAEVHLRIILTDNKLKNYEKVSYYFCSCPADCPARHKLSLRAIKPLAYHAPGHYRLGGAKTIPRVAGSYDSRVRRLHDNALLTWP